MVAVIDSGTRLDHADLAPNIWVNFGEVPGERRRRRRQRLRRRRPRRRPDDDGRRPGSLRRQRARDPCRGDHRRRGERARHRRRRVPRTDHDREGAERAGAGTTAAVAEGIRYAAANGARIINMSLGGDSRTSASAPRSPKPGQRTCSSSARPATTGATSTCSPATRSRSLRRTWSAWPPRRRSPAASSGTFSNFGRATVGLAAPGEEVLSTTSDGAYGPLTGTSMAAPHVSGVAALMAAAAPGLSASELRAQLLQNAVPASIPVGSGYLDALGAVRGVGGARASRSGSRRSCASCRRASPGAAGARRRSCASR